MVGLSYHMPELPEVVFRQKYFNNHCLHQKISTVQIGNPSILYDITPKAIAGILTGKKFISSMHYGKFILAQLDAQTSMAIHFGMTGNLAYSTYVPKINASLHLLLVFENGHALSYTDPRRLGNVSIVPNLEALVKIRNLGPDALKLNYKDFKESIGARSGKVKPLLLDQSFVAGIGNVYADEILFQSCIHPESSVKKFDETQTKDLFLNTQEVLTKMVALEADRSQLDHKKFLIPSRSVGLDCPRKDGGKIEIKTIGGRSTYFCDRCQVKY